MQLTYNEQNLAGAGCLEAHDGGLTQYGQVLIREMARAGITLDLTHVSVPAGRSVRRPGLAGSGRARLTTVSPEGIPVGQLIDQRSSSSALAGDARDRSHESKTAHAWWCLSEREC